MAAGGGVGAHVITHSQAAKLIRVITGILVRVINQGHNLHYM